MRLFLSHSLAVALLLLPGLVPASRAEDVPKERDLPMRSIRLPVAFYPDGALKTEIRARAASMPEKRGDVFGLRVMVMFYRPDGKTLEGRITAESCRFNHAKGTAWGDGYVRVEREGAVLTGQGFDWNARTEVIRIHRDVRVELDRRKVRKEWKHVPSFGR